MFLKWARGVGDFFLEIWFKNIFYIEILIYFCRINCNKRMSNLKNKSDILSLSAQTLHDNCLYTAVPHCAYYSCYQMFKYVWLNKMGKTQKELDSACSQTKIGSHDYLFGQVTNFVINISKNNFKRDAMSLTGKITQLKRLRVNADYLDVDITSTESNQAIQLSSEIIPILNRI